MDMNHIIVNKEKLLATIKANRELHRDAFLEALDGYRTQVIAALEESLAQARAGKKVGKRFVALQEPQDMTRQYDQVIRMLQDSLGDKIEISYEEYSNYVMDDWSWSRQWTASNSMYASSVRGGNFHKYAAGKGVEV